MRPRDLQVPLCLPGVGLISICPNVNLQSIRPIKYNSLCMNSEYPIIYHVFMHIYKGQNLIKGHKIELLCNCIGFSKVNYEGHKNTVAVKAIIEGHQMVLFFRYKKKKNRKRK